MKHQAQKMLIESYLIKEEEDLLLNDSNTRGFEEFFVSANPEAFVQNAKLFYDVKELPKIPSLIKG